MATSDDFEVTTELQVLNSLCQTKDINVVLGSSKIDTMFVAYPDVWDFVKQYYYKYRAIPDSSVLADKFKYFEPVEVKGETAYHVDRLRSEFIEHKLEQVTLKLKENVGKIAPDRIINGVVAEMSKLQELTTQSQDLEVTDFEAAAKRYEETRERARLLGGTPGISTGIAAIDSSYVTGLAGGDLIIVLGWTGRAKSLLTTLICVNAFNQGFKPMIVSLEMKTTKVQDRIYTMLAKGLFSNSDFMLGDVAEDDFRQWSKSVPKGKGFTVISHDGNSEVTPAMIQSKIDLHKPDIIVLDYAQLMSDNANSVDMKDRMRNMSKEYKRLATANNIPIILISSATPDSTTSISGPPIVEQVAWSKQLAYDADLAFAVHRHDIQLEDGSVIIELAGRKNRNGDLFSGFFKADIDKGIYVEHFDIDEIT